MIKIEKAILGMIIATISIMAAGYVLAQDEGAVAWWKFDKGSGPIANDSIGNLPGMITGARWAKGKFGGALKFNLPGDCVNVFNGSILNPKEEITVELWLLIQKYNGSENNIILKQESYGIDLSDNKIRFKIYIKGDYENVTAGDTVNAEAWHHIAGTYSSSESLLVLYLDGAISGTTTLKHLGNYNMQVSEYDLYIGSTTEIPPISGLIDEVKIYNRVLTNKEIIKHAEWR